MIKNKISNNDPNYEILKNEFFNLSNNIYSIKNSLNYSNDTIKDIYLNSNSYLHNLQNYYKSNDNVYVNGNEHPLGIYSEQVLNNLQTTFNEWSLNQSNYFNSINDYCYQFDQIKSKIDKLDSMTTTVTTSPEYINLKNQIFKDVQLQFDNRVNQFDIPLINIQFSFNSFLQSLNSNHNDNSFLLQKPINFNNPISSLHPINPNTTNTTINNNNNRPIGNNNLQNIPRPTPSPIIKQQPQYIPPQQYKPSPVQQSYIPQQLQQQQQQYQQDVHTPPTPTQQPPIKPKSQLRQIERPPPVELPDKQIIEPDIKRKPGDFLRDPNAPRYVPAPTEKYVAKNQQSTMSHHEVSLSESRRQHEQTLANMQSKQPPSRPAPLPRG